MPKRKNTSSSIPSKIDIVERIAQHIGIAEVYLLSSEMERSTTVDSKTHSLKFGRGSESFLNNEDRTIRVIVHFVITEDVPESEHPIFRIKASYSLKYNITGDLSITPDEASLFGQCNGIFNAWPFWREFIYSSLARMGLPPFTLPVMRFGDELVSNND